MENIRRYRAIGSLCRQSAVLNPLNSWKLLGDAERREYLAEAEIALHFKECNTTISSDLAKPATTPDAMTRDGRRWLPREYSSCERLGGFHRAEEGVKGNATLLGCLNDRRC
jgi:hypothetical protein